MAPLDLRIVGPARGDAEGRAAELVAAFAERHVALTPDLAGALARLDDNPAPSSEQIWGQGFQRAGEAVGQARVLGATRFWLASVPCFHATVAEPILRRAMRICGTAVLSGAADLRPVSAPATHVGRDWEDRFNAKVRELLASLDGMGRGFWAEAAVRLYGAAMRMAETRAGRIPRGLGIRAAVPDPDPLLCRLLFEGEPALPDDFRVKRLNKRTRNKSQRKRAGYRPKEGGVAGIRNSTSPEDLPDAVFTEFVMPSELILDRLLHEGLIVRHRPPYRQPKRDLLVVGLSDGRASSGAAALAKAAWADAALRLQMLLAQMGLELSDLMWCEAGPAGLSADVLRVEDASELPAGLNPLMLSGAQRQARLFQSGLLPGFTDTLSGMDAEAMAETRELDDLLPSLVRAGLRRLRLRRNPARGHLGQGPDIGHRPADYACRVAIVFLGASGELVDLAQEDWAAVRGRLRGALRASFEDDMRIIGVVLPNVAEPGAAFTVLGELVPGGRAEVVLDAEVPAREALDRVTGRLSAVFMSAVLEAIDAR